MESPSTPDSADRARFLISRFTAEFVDSEVELAFRTARHAQVVRDTRWAFIVVAVICMAMAIPDFLLLGPGDAFYALLKGRLLVSALCLALAVSARRYWRALMDGLTPTVVTVIGVTAFLSMTLLRPIEPGWHGMSMLLILSFLYLFIPNRFFLTWVLALSSTLLFVVLLDAHFGFSERDLVNLGILMAAANLLGARAAYRNSWRMREEYRQDERQRQTQSALDRESALRTRLQAEREGLANSDGLSGSYSPQHFHALLEEAIHRSPASPGGAPPISLLVLEADYFKQISTSYGYHHGEAVLNHLIALCRRVRPVEDKLARLGEAKFAALLYDVDSRAGSRLAERLRAELHRTPLRLPAAAVYVSASFGLAQWRPGESSVALMQAAEAALARAKSHGGDRIELRAAVAPPLEGDDGGVQNATSNTASKPPAQALATLDTLPECS